MCIRDRTSGLLLNRKPTGHLRGSSENVCMPSSRIVCVTDSGCSPWFGWLCRQEVTAAGHTDSVPSQFNSAVGARTCRGRCSQHCAPVPVLTNTPAGAELVLVLRCPLVDYSALGARPAGNPRDHLESYQADRAYVGDHRAAGIVSCPVLTTTRATTAPKMHGRRSRHHCHPCWRGG